MSEKPCPACDIERAKLDGLAVLAFGVALGAAFGVNGLHGVTESMCVKHRPLYLPAMMRSLSASCAAREVTDG